MKLFRNTVWLTLKKCLASLAQAEIALCGLLYSTNALSLELLTKVSEGGCFIDLNSHFDAKTIVERGVSVWRL